MSATKTHSGDNTDNYALSAITVTLFLGVTLALATFLFVRYWEEQRLQSEFVHLVDLHTASLERELEVNLAVLRGLKDFLRAEPAANRHQFSIYTSGPVNELSTLQALEWIPRVPHKFRDFYEALAQADGLRDFGFTENQVPGEMVAAATRDEYYPVYYVEPLQGNEAALGFDLSSNPARRASLEHSRDTGQLVATGPISLVQDTAQQSAFLVFQPIYDGPIDTLQERRESIKGFALGVYRVHDIFAVALSKSQLKPEEVSIYLTDRTHKDSPKALVSHLPGQKEPPSSAIKHRRSINLAGRNWVLEAHPTGDFLSGRRGTAPLLSAALVMFLSLSLAAYFRILHNRSQAVRQLVKSRTQALAESEARTRAILNTAVNAIITIDSQGRIQLFNPGAEKMFDYRAEEVQGRNVKMLMPAPYREEHDGYIHRYRQEHTAHIIGIGREVMGKRKNGETFPIHLSVGESHLGGQSLFVGVISDITLQKESEQALVRAKESAEASSRMKSEFVNMMSHELRTPLTVILGYIPVLKKAEALKGPTTIASIAEDIQASGDHLLSLINDLLDISKIEAGKLDLKIEKLSLPDVINQAQTALKLKAENKHIALLAVSDEGNLHADPIRLQQILINLVGNAIKFTDHGSVSIQGKHLGDRVEIDIEDTGCGIQEAEQAAIFEKFHQIDSSSTRAVGGSGLGLAITRHLVELHNGTIDVVSTPGEGSIFRITIPVERK